MSQFKQKQNALDEVADEILKNALKDSQKTQMIADRLLKANMLRNETNRTLKKVQAINSDDGEEEEEEEEEDDFADKIFKDLVSQFVSSRSAKGSQPQENGAPASDGKVNMINNFLGSLTPQQKQALIDKFLK